MLMRKLALIKITNVSEVMSLLAAAVQQQCFSQQSGSSGYFLLIYGVSFPEEKVPAVEEDNDGMQVLHVPPL